MKKEAKLVWDRVEGEPIRAYEAFNLFRKTSISERSMRSIAKKFKHRSTSTMSRWRQAWNWDKRAEEWDEYVIGEQRKIEFEQALEEVKVMNKRQADESAAFQRALTLPVSALSKILERRREEVLAELEDLPVSVLYNMITKGAQAYAMPSKTERVARGVPSDIERIEGVTLIVDLPEGLED